jgi:hypothetical protein
MVPFGANVEKSIEAVVVKQSSGIVEIRDSTFTPLFSEGRTEAHDKSFLHNDNSVGGPSTYEIISKLGEGSFAFCVKIIHQGTGALFAGRCCQKGG